MMRGLRARLVAMRAGELGGLAGDSAYSAMWQGAVSIADVAQIALVTHLLGLAAYGRLALVMSIVVLVGQFFDVRVGTAETTFGAERIESRDWEGAAGVFRFGYSIDALTGVLGFVVVACAAPLVGPSLIGSGGTELILLYGLTLLVSTVDDSSATVLRLLGRFRLLAGYMAGLEAARVAAVGIALGIDRSLSSVLVALVLYDIAGALVNFVVANHAFSRASGRLFLGQSSEPFIEKRAMFRTIFHTNVVSYARIAQVQLPTLLLGALTSTSQVGLYKVGTAAGAIVGRVIDPVYAAVLPRLSRLWSTRKRREIACLLRDATPIAAGVVGVTFLLLVIFRSPVLRLIGGSDAVAAAPVLVLVGAGYAVSGIFFWNTSLLFAAGRSGIVSLVALSSAVIQVVLLVPLTIAFEATGAALALCVSLVVSNLLASALAVRALRALPQGAHRVLSTSNHCAIAPPSEYEVHR
jgi:O-antigen/teichoic acid export membrane protein